VAEHSNVLSEAHATPHVETPDNVILLSDVRNLTSSMVTSYNPTKYRIADVVLSFLMLTLLSPLMLLIAAAVKLSSSGPIFFKQVRVGYMASEFGLLKFRTMRDGSDDSIHREYVTNLLKETGPESQPRDLYKLDNDPRITPVGRFLRRFSLDELPQLINVLLGQMSLVGPRPALSWEVELFQPTYFSRFLVRPGMTGLWQVNGRNRVSVTTGLDLDLEFVRRQSLRLYFTILLKTLPAVLMGNGAC
jgi:lipopolysaccharide/colanic/teichoic acid biosynthesis glycosyltransferase